MPQMRRILIVDDVVDWQRTLSGLLADEGYDVLAVSDRESAVKAVKAHKFGLAIIDIRLDETDEDNTGGLSLAKEVKRILGDLPVIMITGYGTPDMIRRALAPDEAGRTLAVDLVRKGEDYDIIGAVNRILSERQFDAVSDCNVTILLESGQLSLIRSRGLVKFTRNSRRPLDLDPLRFARRADDLLSSPSRRFNLQEIGRDLYRLLFLDHPVVLRGYHESLGKARRAERLHLVFESSRDFIGVPLEFLFTDDNEEYVSLTHPLVRRIRNVTTERESLSPDLLNQMQRRNQKLRVLLITSDTRPPIAAIDDMGRELHLLLAAHDWIEADLILTKDATYERVRRELKECRYDIVQYIGHGLYKKESPEQSGLFFWEGANRSGQMKPMKAVELKLLLQTSEVRLLHLTCCEGAREGEAAHLLDDDFLGIADAAIQAGLPSVLGFRWPVSVDGARKFSLEFYGSLVNNGSPEVALLEARRELAMVSKDDPTWASSILIVQS